jgi:hypothetical protein
MLSLLVKSGCASFLKKVVGHAVFALCGRQQCLPPRPDHGIDAIDHLRLYVRYAEAHEP